jgi:sortase A
MDERMKAPTNRLTRMFVGAAVLVAATWHLSAAAYIPLKAALAQKLLEHSWERSRQGNAAPRPWPWADTFPVARLRAPRQGVDLIVLSGASGRTMAFGPGHLEGSALPGEPGRSVIAAHRDTHFAFLEKVAVGDSLEVLLPDGRDFHFVVSGAEVVNSRRVNIDLDVPGAALVLVTCYPFDAVRAGGPLRYQVTAERVRT